MEVFVEADRVDRRTKREQQLAEEAEAREQRRLQLASAAAMKKGRHWAMCREVALLMIDVVTEVCAAPSSEYFFACVCVGGEGSSLVLVVVRLCVRLHLRLVLCTPLFARLGVCFGGA